MKIVEELRRAAVVAGLTVRYLLTTRRAIVTALLAMVPVIVVLSMAAARVQSFGIVLFQILMVPLFLQVVLIFVTIVQAGSLIREEIDDDTLPYLLTRPISKPAVVLYKYLGYVVAMFVLLVPPLVVAYGVTEAYTGSSFGADLDVLGAFLAVTVLGGLAYGAIFTLLSVGTRRPLFAGLMFGFVWEGIVGSIPGDVPKLSVIYYLRSILQGQIATGPLHDFGSKTSAGVAAAVIVGFTIAALIVAMLVFQQAEFKQKA